LRWVSAERKRVSSNIIREWDSKIFPNTNSSLVVVKAKSSEDNRVKRAMASLDADSDDENENLLYFNLLCI
jgi:hypothetical protein